MPTPCLIPLPGGPAVSGVARFALRLAGALAERGRPVGLLPHAPAAGVAPLKLALPDGVRVFDAAGLPPIEQDAEPSVPLYGRAIDELGASGPVAVILGQHAGPFAATAKLLQTHTDRIRAIGVAHSDNGYDARVLAHYEPMLHRLVGVSERLTQRLTRALPERSQDIARIPYGVEIPASPAPRPPIGGRPLRLLYAGRLEHRQKRITALPMLSAELDRRGIDHELTIVGDGPARAELEAMSRGIGRITLRPPALPAEVVELLSGHDVFVLPSRFEGLSIAMLEALAHGCIPVVAPSASGTGEAVIPGITGEVAACTPDDDEPRVAMALADAVDALRRRDLAEMAQRCRDHAARHFSLGAHADAWSGVIDDAAHGQARGWPEGRTLWFSSPGGSVPADAADRLRRVLGVIGAQPIAVHGAGAHTLALADALADARLVCITDDDRQRHGEAMLGVPIVAPGRTASLGATHVVISTHLHEDDVWRRRGVYEDQGLVVHRLYG